MNKLTKLLSVFVIAGAVGASVAGIAGCKKGHTHKIDVTKWTNNFDGTHDGFCSCGELMVDDEEHVPENGVCVKCGASENEVIPGNVTLDTSSSVSSVGKQFTITATISNASQLTNAQKVLTWVVEDPTVASINVSQDTSTVTVTCLKIGTTKITVTTVNGNTAEYNLEVSLQANDVKITDEEGNEIDRIALTSTSGDVTLLAKILPEGSTDTEVVWTSSNPAVATVTPDAANPNKAVVSLVAQGENILITATVKNKNIKTSIFCTANDQYGDLVNDTENLILNENFSSYNTGDVLGQWGGSWGTKGVYGNCNGKVAGDTYGAKNQVKIVTEADNNNNNRATLIDTSDSGTELYVDFGAVDGVVKGYANIKMVEYGASWTFAQIHGKDTSKPGGGEILGLRAGSEYLKVRVNGTEQDGLVKTIKPATGSTVRLYFEIDINNDTAVIYVNGTKFYEAAAGTLGITDLMGIKLVSSDNGAKTLSVDNIAVTHVGVSLEARKTDLLAKLDTEYAKYTETDYSSTHWSTLQTAYTTAKTTITNASTKEEMNQAFTTAVKAMKNVPTAAGEALYNAKEAYKTEVSETYPEADRTYNATAYTTAWNKVVAAIDAYNGEIAGLKTATAVVAAVNELGAVKTDTTVISEAKTAAVTALQAHKGGSAKFTINATAYGAALETHTGNINAVALPESGVTKEIVEGKLADITAALNAGKTAIDGVNTDAEELAATKTAAIETITNYKFTEIDALTPGESMTQEAINKAKTNIQATKSNAIAAIQSADNIAEVNEEVEAAKKDIDSFIAALSETLEQVKTRETATLTTIYNELKEDVTDQIILGLLQEDYDGAVAKIEKATDKTRVAELRAEGATAMRVRVARHEAYLEITAHADSVKSDLHSESGKTAIDNEIKYDLDSITSEDEWSAHMWAIHSATTLADVEEAKQTVLDKIDELAETAKSASYKVTLGTTGEELSVKYGTELKLGAISVTAYNVTAATYGDENTPITAESGVTVYDDITINVTTAEKSNYSPAEKWEGSEVSQATAVGGEGVVQDNGLYKLSVQATSTYVSTGVSNNSSGKQFTTATISGTAYANVINVCPVASGGNSSATPIKIEVKDNLKTLKIYTLGAGANGTDNRPGSTYYVINDGEPTVVSGQAQAYELKNLKGGDVVKVYVSNTSGSGGNFYLAKVEAAIDEAKVAKTVTVKWKGAGASGADLTEEYRYYDKITATADPKTGNGKFIGWYNMTTGDKFEGGKLAAGSYQFEARYEYNVKITYKVNEEDEEGIPLYIYAEDGNDLLEQLPVLEPKDGNAHSGWTYANGTAIDFATIVIGTAAAPAEYNFAPVYVDATSIKVEAITVSAPKGEDGEPITNVVAGKTIQLTATVKPDNAYNKSVTWSCATVGVTVSETGLVTVGKDVAAGTVVITATAKDTVEGGTPVTGTITLTVEEAPEGDIYTCGKNDAEVGKGSSIDIATGVSVKATGNKWANIAASKSFSEIDTTITNARIGKEIEITNNRTSKITLTFYIMDASSGGGKKNTVGDITVDGSALAGGSYTIVNDSADKPDYAIVTVELAAGAKTTIKTANYMAVYAIVIV